MEIYKFRVLPDSVPDVFRDIEIAATDTFENLHLAILRAFEFEGLELASFYLSDDEWEKGEEIALLDVGDGDEVVHPMVSTQLKDLLNALGSKLFYLYDFMRMWIFYVELVEISVSVAEQSYPHLALSFGHSPDEHSKLPEDLPGMEGDFDEDEDDFDEEYGFDEEDFGGYSIEDH